MGLAYRILDINHKKDLLRSLWVLLKLGTASNLYPDPWFYLKRPFKVLGAEYLRPKKVNLLNYNKLIYAPKVKCYLLLNYNKFI